MSNNKDAIFVGLIITTFGFILNELFKGQTTFVWIIGLFLVVLLGYILFQQSRGFPFTKYRFSNENTENGERLLLRKDVPELNIRVMGKSPNTYLQFQTAVHNWVVFGPYLRKVLRKGKYRAIYRVKIDNVSSPNEPIIQISVASNSKERGDKSLAERVLTTLDFQDADTYYSFPLDFYLISDERELELRVYSRGNGHTVSVESIQLVQRLL